MTECQHGSLRRACPICERDDEIKRLREAARAALSACQRVIHECDPGPDPTDVQMFADADATLMALREALGDAA